MKELTIELPENCALRCRHCSHDRVCELQVDYPGWEEHEFGPLLDLYGTFKKVRISGGEPFSQLTSLLAILRQAKQRNRYTEVLSSGVCSRDFDGSLEPIPEEVLRTHSEFIDNIGFTIHGDRQTHDFITQTLGSFDCLRKSVDLARKYQVHFSFNFVAMRPSLAGLEHSLDCVRYYTAVVRKEVPFRILRFIKQGDSQQNLALDVEQVLALRRRVPLLEEKYGVKIYLGCSLVEKGCRAGEGKAVETAHGGSFACSSLKGYDGEVQPKSFPCRVRW